jgi:ribonucleoside-triphosphate reductase
MNRNSLLGALTYASRYSRPDVGCTSYQDSVAYLAGRVLGIDKETVAEIMELAKRRVLFPSMRGVQFLSGVLNRNERLFNCAGIIIDRWEQVHKVFYLLLCGCGVGFNISKRHISKLSPVIRPSGREVVYSVEDSVYGWAMALRQLICSYTEKDYGIAKFSFERISPKGTILRSCGRPAPGPEPLREMLEKVRAKLDSMVGRPVRPIDVYDIICMASSCVVSGGVRRSALIALFDMDDEDMQNAKVGDWWVEHPYRSLSNNSFILTPSIYWSLTDYERYNLYRETLVRCLEYGEPGVVHLPSLDHVVNPCCEIVFYPWIDGVSSYQLCNLTEVSVFNARRYGIDVRRAIELATIIGTYQASFDRMADVVAHELVKRDALLGVSLTGIFDVYQDYDWSELARHAVSVNVETAKRLGINPAARVTCIKPSGTVSCLAGHSSGIHPWFSTGLRNVTFGESESTLEIYKTLVGKDSDWFVKPHPFVKSLKVCPFPYTALGKTWDETSPLELLQRVCYMTGTWIRNGYNPELSKFHNSVSCTLMFDSADIDILARTLRDMNDEYLSKHGCFPVVGLSFLAKTNKHLSNVSPFCPVWFSQEVEETYHRLAELEKGLDSDYVDEVIRKHLVPTSVIGEMNGGCDNETCVLR